MEHTPVHTDETATDGVPDHLGRLGPVKAGGCGVGQVAEAEAPLAAADLLNISDFGNYMGMDLPGHEVIDGPLDAAEHFDSAYVRDVFLARLHGKDAGQWKGMAAGGEDEIAVSIGLFRYSGAHLDTGTVSGWPVVAVRLLPEGCFSPNLAFIYLVFACALADLAYPASVPSGGAGAA